MEKNTTTQHIPDELESDFLAADSSASSSSSSCSPSPPGICKIAGQETKNRPRIDRNRMEEMKEVFRKYDANGDGRISSEELRSCLRALGFRPSPPELRQAMTEMDKNGDGYIDLREFAEFHSADSGGRSSADSPELREAFGVYDKDKNGLISAGELRAVMKQLGEKVSLKDCARMIKTVDLDGDGSVNFEEFAMMMSNPSARPATK